MSIEVYKLLKNLTETPGPSGNESQIAELVQTTWEPLTDSISVDVIGSVIAIKQGQAEEPRRRILLAAHMDEIGLMVKQVICHPDESGSGFLRVTNIGDVDRRHLFGQMVVVHGSSGRDLVGIIGSLPARMLPEKIRNKTYSFEELVIDPGISFASLNENVSVGDFISFRQPLRKLLNKRVSGKALDNRASVAAVTVCLDYLRRRKHDWDVIAVATAQEETGLLGAFTSAFAQRPDLAIAIDVTFGKGPGVSDELTYELNGGPTLGLGPNVHPGVFSSLKSIADAMEMKSHDEPHNRASGTDAFGLQVAREGIPTGLVSIPIRYMHTMVESLALADVKRAGRLLGEFIISLDDDYLPGIQKEYLGKGGKDG